ncbi:MAG: NAD/NADP octopine/nopaline dehydrogenase family protein [Thermovirgaceae bacterium]|jgi:opine dehydrogenase|nr:NAD/NADP octopine/nopaline dehydrogenase family protein [Synergistales bacterium]MDI9392322.1 NAD/NADP octopine/nopaline dehydrogenase family protein [Synergistota bacterium]HRV70819.1 NAD/NADP octopine/nopaline dehydrogenase family protein [Thermovirgaceae bacterium]MDD3134450.1 NAD/NADP octopine/nopaline dehydrogenase family protein [Synergistales bacterium]MDD3830861.1 NAD/NADP octopine/nopaline dehydrogenase family protein [Synergistales bacterium]
MGKMDYLQEKPIAVLGGGATARGHAACAALAGREVRLYELPDFFEGLGCIKENREIRLSGIQESLYGFKREGLAKIDVVTSDMEEAVKGAGIIVVSFPAVGYKAFLEKLIPRLEDGMVVHFTTANFGSLIMRKMMRESGCSKRIVIGEWSSQPYGIRIKSAGGQQMPEVSVNYWAISLRGSALPMIDQEKFFESKQYLPSLDSVVHPVRGDTVADIGFSNVNPILHCPGTILGVGTMENWGVIYGGDKHDFSIYSHAYCPSISKVQLALYKEECAIAEAMGVGIQQFSEESFFSRSNILGSEHMGGKFKVPFDEQYKLALGTGPFSIYNRYITEDIPVGCHIFRELGKKFGVKVPVIESMITLASVMTGVDYWSEGVTLNDLGIEHMDREALNAYLREGTYL